MVNSKLIRELEKDKKGHILFNSQKASDLSELKDKLQREGHIVVDFPLNEWTSAANIVFNEPQGFQLRAARKYVATKLLIELEKKFPMLREYSMVHSLPIFQAGDREAYQRKEDTIYNLFDVQDILSVEGISIDRVHFIMNGTRSSMLCDALSMLLGDDIPFSTTIYSSPNAFYTYTIPDSIDKKTIYDEYTFKSFDGFDEGVKHKAKRPKQKQKKNEEV